MCACVCACARALFPLFISYCCMEKVLVVFAFLCYTVSFDFVLMSSKQFTSSNSSIFWQCVELSRCSSSIFCLDFFLNFYLLVFLLSLLFLLLFLYTAWCLRVKRNVKLYTQPFVFISTHTKYRNVLKNVLLLSIPFMFVFLLLFVSLSLRKKKICLNHTTKIDFFTIV